MRLSVSRRGLTKLVESCFESSREFFGETSTPVMLKDDHGPVAGRVMMNRDNVEPFLRSHLQNGSDFVIEHRYVARNDRVFLRCR